MNDTRGFDDEWSVLVIGGDHYNTLGTIRNLGKAHIDYSLLVHGEQSSFRETMLAYSKYAPKERDVVIVSNSYVDIYNAIENWIKDKNAHRVVAYACSDLGCLVLDEAFAERGVRTFGFERSGNHKSLTELMRKDKQSEWALSVGMPALPSYVARAGEAIAFEAIKIPCIIKPLVSAFGRKTDIRIAYSHRECQAILDKLFEMGYEDLLIQEFISYSRELLAIGCVLPHGATLLRGFVKDATDPVSRGNTALFHNLKDDSSIRVMEHLASILSEQGYRGSFDFEFFETDSGLILNEINFRQSAPAFAMTNLGIPLSELWVRSVVSGEDIIPDNPFDGVSERHVVEPLYLKAARSDGTPLLKALGTIISTKSRCYISDNDFGVLFYKVLKRAASLFRR